MEEPNQADDGKDENKQTAGHGLTSTDALGQPQNRAAAAATKVLKGAATAGGEDGDGAQ
jgi:hypothetical protein